MVGVQGFQGQQGRAWPGPIPPPQPRAGHLGPDGWGEPPWEGAEAETWAANGSDSAGPAAGQGCEELETNTAVLSLMAPGAGMGS